MLHANVYDAMRKRAQGASLASCTSKDDAGFPWCTILFWFPSEDVSPQ